MSVNPCVFARIWCNSEKYGQFTDVGDTDEEIQGARYLWLMFAYQVALDEGV